MRFQRERENVEQGQGDLSRRNKPARSRQCRAAQASISFILTSKWRETHERKKEIFLIHQMWIIESILLNHCSTHTRPACLPALCLSLSWYIPKAPRTLFSRLNTNISLYLLLALLLLPGGTSRSVSFTGQKMLQHQSAHAVMMMITKKKKERRKKRMEQYFLCAPTPLLAD